MTRRELNLFLNAIDDFDKEAASWTQRETREYLVKIGTLDKSVLDELTEEEKEMSKNNLEVSGNVELQRPSLSVIDDNLSNNVDDKTLESIVESEMKSMGLNPRDQKDVDHFWAQKGLLG